MPDTDRPLDVTRSPSLSAAPAKAGRTWPWWMAPVRAVGRWRPMLLATAGPDADGLAGMGRWPGLVPPVLVVVLCVVVSIFHATSTLSTFSGSTDWFRLSADDVFTDAVAFVLLAILVGTTSPTLGAFLTLVFGILDLAAASVQRNELTPLPWALMGRLVGLWLLWLLVVEIPVLGRGLALATPRVARSRPILAVLVGLTTGLLFWIWTIATPVLIRPVFTWSDNGQPQLASIVPLQQDGLVFAVVAGLAALVGALLRGPRGLMDAPVRPEAPAPTRAPGRTPGWVRRIAVAGLLTIGLGGVIASPLDAVILFVALAGATPFARIIADRTPVGAFVHVVPPLGRYLAGAVIVLVVSSLLMPPLVALGGPTEFFPLIVVIVLGIFVMEVATTAGSGTGRRPPLPATTIGIAAGLTTFLVLTGLLLPGVVLADNCSGLGDCFPQVFAAALAAAAVPALLAAASKSPPPPPEETPPPPPAYPPDYDPGPPDETPPPPPDYPPDWPPPPPEYPGPPDETPPPPPDYPPDWPPPPPEYPGPPDETPPPPPDYPPDWPGDTGTPAS